MGDMAKIAAGGLAALVLLGQCSGGGIGGKAKAAAGGAAVGAGVGGAVGFGAGAGAAGAASGLKGGVKSRVEDRVKGVPNGPSRTFTPGETTAMTPADLGLVVTR